MIETRIVAAAIRVRLLDGTFYIAVGARHYDVFMARQLHAVMALIGGERHEQGFIDNRGGFVTRQEAWRIAEAAGQVVRRVGSDGPDRRGLFSENMY